MGSSTPVNTEVLWGGGVVLGSTRETAERDQKIINVDITIIIEISGTRPCAGTEVGEDQQYVFDIDDAIPVHVARYRDIMPPTIRRNDLLGQPSTFDTRNHAGTAAAFKELKSHSMQPRCEQDLAGLLVHPMKSIVVDDHLIPDVQA